MRRYHPFASDHEEPQASTGRHPLAVAFGAWRRRSATSLAALETQPPIREARQSRKIALREPHHFRSGDASLRPANPPLPVSMVISD